MSAVDRHLKLLPGVPLIDSPFFQAISEQGYFTAAEQQIAIQLHEKGYAVLDFPDPEINQRADRIRATLEPLFAQARDGEHRFDGRLMPPRFQDAHHEFEDVRSIAANPQLLALLTKLYGRQAFPFQTLNFDRGSQQHPHTDAVHFHCMPRRFMCGVWVALEDVTVDNGPLCYYPGSHQWAVHEAEHIVADPKDLNSPPSQAVYHELWNALVKTHGVGKDVFLARKGQALIWTAQLLHGGEPIINPDSTRWSQVSHYYFENCAYYRPMASHPVAGQIAFLEPNNILSGEPVVSHYSGEPLPGDYLASCQHRTLGKPEPLPDDFDADAYLALNPDVKESGADPQHHYITHGRLEGRQYKAE